MTTNTKHDFAFDFEVLGEVLGWLQLIAVATELDADSERRVKQWESLTNYLAEKFAATAEGMREKAEDYQILTSQADKGQFDAGVTRV